MKHLKADFSFDLPSFEVEAGDVSQGVEMTIEYWDSQGKTYQDSGTLRWQ